MSDYYSLKLKEYNAGILEGLGWGVGVGVDLGLWKRENAVMTTAVCFAERLLFLREDVCDVLGGFLNECQNQNQDQKSNSRIFQLSNHEVAIPDVIIHLAAQAGVRHSIENPLQAIENIKSTLVVLEFAANIYLRFGKRVKVIIASSSSVYGADSKAPFYEWVLFCVVFLVRVGE